MCLRHVCCASNVVSFGPLSDANSAMCLANMSPMLPTCLHVMPQAISGKNSLRRHVQLSTSTMGTSDFGTVVNGHRQQSRSNTPGRRGMFFASNALYRLKNYIPKSQRLARKILHMMYYLMFIFLSSCDQNLAINSESSHKHPPKPGKLLFFYQTIGES